MAVLEILKTLVKEKFKLEEELKGLEGTLAGRNKSVLKEYGVAIRRVERNIRKVQQGPNIQGYKNKEASERAIKRYKDLSAKNYQNFIDSNKDLLPGVSDRGAINQNLYITTQKQEIERAEKIEKDYISGKLTKQELQKEIARTQSRLRRDVYSEGRNTKQQIKKAMYKDLERKYLEQQAENGYGKFKKDGTFEIASAKESERIEESLKGLRRSYETRNVDEYANYFVKKVGEFGKYEEGYEYDRRGTQQDSTYFELRDI